MKKLKARGHHVDYKKSLSTTWKSQKLKITAGFLSKMVSSIFLNTASIFLKR